MEKIHLLPRNTPLVGEIHVTGDKSITHRAIILGSLAKGITKVTNFLNAEDCWRTIQTFQSLGITIEQQHSTLTIRGKGKCALKEPSIPLYFGNSGTTARLLLGILSGLPFFTTMYGDSSLNNRPMQRIVQPLKQMGACIDGRSHSQHLPLAVRGGKLRGIHYTLPVNSAQVKSAILLAGLFAEGTTTVIEKVETRNHTENMLRTFGADITVERHGCIKISNKKDLEARHIDIPGDISSAAYFIAAAAIFPGSNLIIKNVGLNETRTGILDVLKQMGASIMIRDKKCMNGECFGNINVKYSNLKGTIIEGNIVPRLIDEIPIIALIATQAEGSTIIRDASELRVKETDRIKAIVNMLLNLGA